MNHRYHSKTFIVPVLSLCIGFGLLWQQIEAAENSRITDGSLVTFSYQITVPGEEGLEISDVSRFIQGEKQLLPGLEQAVTGMKIGDEKQVELSAEEAFGPYEPGKKRIVPRAELPADAKEGDLFVDHRTGEQVTVDHLSDNAAVMDYNHPLAGKPIIVKFKILKVEDPAYY